MLFPFLSGIITAISFDGAVYIFPWVTILFVLTLFRFIHLRFTRQRYRNRWIPGLLIHASLFLVIFQLVSIKISENAREEISSDPEGWMVGELTEAVSVRKGIMRSVISLRYRHREGVWSGMCGKSVIYFRSGIGQGGIQYGDHLLFHASFQRVDNNGNPGSFSYAKYLKNRGIQYLVWLQPGDWKVLRIGSSDPLIRYSLRLRDHLLDRIRGSGMRNDEFAVAAALLLGYVDELGSDLRNSYSATGVTHILSVSGMHVGIIFLFLEFLLGFLNRSRIGKLAKVILMLFFIWFYAFLTGLSPAVLRAAAMLSFIIICRSLKRSPELLNILAASLFFLLIYNPLLILDIGFQLSYLAVAGIILANQPVCGLLRSKFWVIQKIWAIMAVTLSAQIATTPLSLYYFHQFPNYFLITNLFVVPFSSLIIYAGIAAVGLSWIPYAAVFSAKVLSLLVRGLNFFIRMMEMMPAATTKGIFIPWFEVILIYVILISLLLYLFSKRKGWISVFLSGCILMTISSVCHKISRLGNEGMMVYNFKNISAVEFSSEGRAILIYDPEIIDRSGGQMGRMLGETGNSWNDRGIGRTFVIWQGGNSQFRIGSKEENPLFRRGMFFQFCGRKVGILKDKIPKGIRTGLKLDYLVISRNARVSIGEVERFFRPGKIILDGTNSRARTEQWCRDAAKHGIPCFPVSRMGAMMEEFWVVYQFRFNTK